MTAERPQLKHGEYRTEYAERVEAALDAARRDLSDKAAFTPGEESNLAAIAHLVDLRREIDAVLDLAVLAARRRTLRKSYSATSTWADVGLALGTSGQAANQKYGRQK